MDPRIQEDWGKARPSPTDFDTFLPWACTQLSVEAKVVITKTSMSEYVSVATSDRPKNRIKTPKYKSASFTVVDSNASNTTDDSVSLIGPHGVENEIYIETIYDNNGNLVQLKFPKNKTIPWQVMRIIGLIIPYYKHLTSININSGLRMESIYEISKFLPTSKITEICFDYSYLIEGNYHILLDQSSLKHLSLAKCNLNDIVVKTIALKLVHPYNAAKTLTVLNLATNRITDTGAKYLAEALRTNRHLSYLNLADNLITDIGAICILDTLVEFPLTSQESLEKKARHMIYLKEKLQLIVKTIKDVRAGDFEKKPTKRRAVKSTAPTTTQKRTKPEKDSSVIYGNVNRSFASIDAALHEKAEAIVETLMGPFNDPYDPSNTVMRYGIVYCHGNNSLCYLNFAYNNLTFVSIKKLHEVLVTQRLACRTPRGLVNVRIDGNYLPEFCTELVDIDVLLEYGLASVRKMSTVKKKPGYKPGPSKSH